MYHGIAREGPITWVLTMATHSHIFEPTLPWATSLPKKLSFSLVYGYCYYVFMCLISARPVSDVLSPMFLALMWSWFIFTDVREHSTVILALIITLVSHSTSLGHGYMKRSFKITSSLSFWVCMHIFSLRFSAHPYFRLWLGRRRDVHNSKQVRIHKKVSTLS